MPSSTAVALFWVAVAVCTLAQVALLHSFFLGASRPARGSTVMFRATETAWAIVPAVVLALLLAGTWRAMHLPATRHIQVTVPADAPLAPPPSMVAPSSAPTASPAIVPAAVMGRISAQPGLTPEVQP